MNDAHSISSTASSTTKSSVLVVGVLFTAVLILSNLTGSKITSMGSFHFPAGLFFFPLTYFFDDILTEVYGFKTSRRIIWMALIANLIVLIGTWSTIYLTPSPEWPYQEAYATIYQSTFRIFIASVISYFFGEFINSIILAKLKIVTHGKHLWFRVVSSSIIGIGIDTIIFMHLAFLFTLSYRSIWEIIATIYTFKIAYEICALPITYQITRYLKKKDNIDHYDVNTKFNPFSLEM